MASGIMSYDEHKEYLKKKKKKEQEVKQPSGIVSSDNYNFVAKQILDPTSSSSSTIGIDDVKSFNDIQQYAYTNQKSYKEQEKEYKKSVEKTNKDRASLLNKGGNLGIDYANEQGGLDVGIKYNAFEKPTEKSVTERDKNLPIYVKLAEKAKTTNKNRIDIPLSPENTSLTEGRPVYENKEKRKEAIAKETERQQKAYDENIKDTEELKDFKDRILRKNAVLEYSKNVAKSREDKSNSGKYTSPFMAGLDNALISFQNNKFEDESGNIISLPTYNDIRASEFREKSDSKIYKAYSDLSQSVAGMVPGIAAGAISGGLGSAVFFANTYNTARNDALLQGYDANSASNYALINATLELGVGKVLGGASAIMGKSPAAKAIGSKVTSKIMSNPVLASVTADMVSEFGEEYVQEWLDPKVKAYFLEHKSLGESWDSSSFIDKQNLYAGFLGAMSAGIMNTPGAVRQQLNLNSQVDSLIQSAEIEKGSKLTDAEKKSIKQSFYNEYNKAMKQSKTTKSEDFNVDYDASLQNSGILNNVNNQNINFPSIKQNTIDTSNMNLSESATAYGLDGKSEAITNIQNLLENRGIKGRYDASLFENSGDEAFWSRDSQGNRQAIFNPKASESAIIENIAMHEMAHDLMSSTNSNNTLKPTELLDYVKTLDGYENARKSLEQTYSKIYDPNSQEFKTLMDEEVVADILGTKLGNQEFIQQLTTKKPGLAKTIYNWVVDKLNSIVNSGGKVRSERLYWKNVKNNFEKAYRMEYENNSNIADTRFKSKVENNSEIEYNKDGIYINDKNEYGSLRNTIRQFQASNPSYRGKTFVENGSNFYTFDSNGFDNYNVTSRIPIAGNEELIDTIKGVLNNEINRNTNTIDSIIDEVYTRRNINNRNNVDVEEGTTTRENDRLYNREQEQFNKTNDNESNGKINRELDNSSFSFKQKQLDAINESNAAPDEYHTWIRNVEDINTFKEAFFKDGEYSGMDPDFTEEMANKALESGKITVYSSYPIENGVFVSPSKMEAQQYAGGDANKLYSKEVNLDDVAWIDGAEGQYAKVDTNIKPLNERVSGDKLLDALDLIDEVKSVGAKVDENGYITLYHQTTNENANKIRETGKMSGKENGIFFSTSENASQADGRGTTKLEFKIPAEKLILDDLFEDNADLKINSKPGEQIDVSNYLVDTNTQTSTTDNQGDYTLSVKEANTGVDSDGDKVAPKMQKYMENSKLTDSKGNLKVAYHGTQNYDFNEFEGGTFLTDDYMNADGYAGGERIIAAYVNMENPLVIECDGAKWDNLNTPYGTSTREIASGLDESKYDGIIFKNINDNWIDDEEAGYPGDVYYVPNSNQIKNIDNENPTKSGDIRYSKQNETWQQFLEDNFKSEGTKTKMKDLKLPTKEKVNIPTKADIETEPKKEKRVSIPLAKKDNVLRVKANNIAKQINETGGFDLKERSWARTSTESDVLKDSVYIEDLDPKKISYTVKTNKKSLENANNKIKNLGYEGALNHAKELMNSDKLPSASEVALIERMIQEASKRGDVETAQNLIMDAAILGTDLGQATQALSIIQKLTPEGQLKLYTKMVQRAKVRGEKSFQNVEITPEMVQKVLEAYKADGTFDQNDLNSRVESFKQDIANQMKTTVGEKIDAWRYLSMLGNPKTHIRNMVSNVAMKGTIKAKNAVARTLESILPVKERTKTWKKASNEIKNYAAETANEMKGVITGENKYNEKASIESKKQIFKNKTLEKISNFNSNALEAEDWFFSKSAFKNTLQEYLTANNINTMEDIKNNPELVEKAKLYAVEQAEIATFRQYSKLASMINQFERKSKVGKFAIEATVPFKKTPINVAKAGVNYSPLGLIKNITYDAYQLKKGNINASQFIDNISQGMTGTSLTLLGYALAKAGILSGSGDDDKEGKYDSQLGKTGYSVNLGGKSYSISWLSPVAMPLLVGSNAYEQLEEQKDWDMNVVSDSLAKTLDPLNEMSFMQGLTNALQSYGGGADKIKGSLESVAQNYTGQFFPTLFSQIASVGDDTKRSTQAGNSSSYKFGEQTVRGIMYKIPGLRNQLEASTDIWGNEKKQADNILQRAFESFIAPYSSTKDVSTELDNELKRVYKETGETKVIPGIPKAYLKYKDETYRMSAKEYTEYKKTYGKKANEYLNALIDTNSYKNASDDEKADMINNIYKFAGAEANEKYFNSNDIDYTNNTVKELNQLKNIGIDNKSLAEYVSGKTKVSAIRNNDQYTTEQKRKQAMNVFINSNLNSKQLAYLYGKFYSSEKTLNNVLNAGIPMKEFIKFDSQDFDGEFDESTGRAKTNSKKYETLQYIQSLKLSAVQKALLAKSKYSSYTAYDNQIAQYIQSRNLSLLDKYKLVKYAGLKSYDRQIVNYVSGLNKTADEKEKLFKDMGFTTHNGRVYVK